MWKKGRKKVMKNMKFVRTWAMFALAFTVMLSVTGGTIAWFTDSATSANNVIKAGNLDMKVSFKPYGTNYTTWTEVDENTVIFAEDALYEPGYTEAFWLKIENTGNLAFRYNTALKIISEKAGTNKAGESFNLSDYLVVKASPVSSPVEDIESFYNTRKSLDSFNMKEVKLNSTDLTMTTNGAVFAKSDAAYSDYSTGYVLVILQMPDTTGNEANHNGNAPKIDLGLNVVATQLPHEEDGFGTSDYDAAADYPKYVNPNIPQAIMEELKDEELNIVASSAYEGVSPIGTRVYGDQKLSCGVVFSATEEDVTGKPYEKWYVDFEISSSKEITEEAHIILAGHYDFPPLDVTGEWLAADVSGLSLPAEERVQVMASLFGNAMRYDEVVSSVKEFYCGIIVDDYFKGETITLELCIYDQNGENRQVVDSYTYTHQ